jgi:outer membrane immunogenic protein
MKIKNRISALNLIFSIFNLNSMRGIIISLAFVFTTIFSFSQNPLQIKSNQLNIGVGLSGWGIPIYVGFDHWINRDLTLGGEVSFRSYRENWKDYTYNHNITGVSGNLNYHFNRVLRIPPKWDFYAGINLGFYIWSSPTVYEGNNHSVLGLGGQIGTRYNLSNRVGLNLEFGGGNAFSEGKFGLTIKI